MDLIIKTYVTIKLKGFPYGKIVKCYVYFKDNELNHDDISSFIKDNFKLENDYEKYTIHDVKVNNIIYSNKLKCEDEYNKINIINNYCYKKITDEKNKKLNDSLNDKKVVNFNSKVNLDKIILHNQTDDDIKNLIKRLNNELLMREYKLNDKEFDFYLKLNGLIKISNVKKLYEKYNGDDIKFRKNRIRKKIKKGDF